MAKVTLTIEGEPREIRRTMRKLLGPMGSGERRGRCGPDGGERGRGRWGRRHEEMAGMEGRTPWSPEEVKQLWDEITDGARAVLTEIARRPEGYPNVELQQVLKMPGNALGGTLSSVGVASRRFGPKPPIYWFKWEMYRMPPRVAAMIARLATEQSKPKE